MDNLKSNNIINSKLYQAHLDTLKLSIEELLIGINQENIEKVISD